jgi:transcriptional regulator with XRE-family HTH domain
MAITAAGSQQRTIGDLLRQWRQRRRLSQLKLALDADVSTRHLSFLETGRARPSREMVLRLAERLDVPLRERNALLLAAGFAPGFPERSLADPALEGVRAIVARVLAAHEPNPALAIDQYWTLVDMNQAVAHLLNGIPDELLRPPVNVLRLSLHPDGLAPRIANLAEWRSHLMCRLATQIARSGDPRLERLYDELEILSGPAPGATPLGSEEPDSSGVAIPLRIDSRVGQLSFLSTTMVFGAPLDITVAELAIEAFFPADERTAELLPLLMESQSTRERTAIPRTAVEMQEVGT